MPSLRLSSVWFVVFIARGSIHTVFSNDGLIAQLVEPLLCRLVAFHAFAELCRMAELCIHY